MLDILSRHGCPSVVVTDNGTEFSGDFDRLLQRNSIEHVYTSAYHPQANGLAERMNRTLMASLDSLTDAHGTDWDRNLPLTLWGYRTSIHCTTRMTPFFCMYGREATMPVDLKSNAAIMDQPASEQSSEQLDTQLEALTADRITALHTAHEKALGNIERSQQRAVATYARNRKKPAKRKRDSPPGDTVPPSAIKTSALPAIITPEPSPFTPGSFAYVERPNAAGVTSPQLFKVLKLNTKQTTATMVDRAGEQFSVHTSRLSLYKPSHAK